MNESTFPEPHPNLSDEINRNIQQTAILGGVDLRTVPEGKVLLVQTQHTLYRLTRVPDTDWPWRVSGHPKYCPRATPARIHGSTWGGSMIKLDFIGREMFVEMTLDGAGTIGTSAVSEITEEPA